MLKFTIAVVGKYSERESSFRHALPDYMSPRDAFRLARHTARVHKAEGAADVFVSITTSGGSFRVFNI